MINLKFSNTEESFYDVEMDDDGNIYYYNENYRLHRLNGPAVEHIDGYKEYWVDGKRHRLDGPAIIYPNGTEEYWVDDKLHRLDGPAIIWYDGSKEYWINGKELNKKEFDRLTKSND